MSIFYKEIKTDGDITIKKMTSESITELVGVCVGPSAIADYYKGVLLDTETTGMNSSRDKVIEIGLREFYYDQNNTFIGFGESYSGLNDPGMKLPSDIIDLTGITDDELSGKSFDFSKINSICEDAEMIIAHNASFDFPFMKSLASFTDKEILWGCSCTQIPWYNVGFKSASQEMLALVHGFYYTGHRALMDTDALGYLLSHEDYLDQLIKNSKKKVINIKAIKAPFESKDLLKDKKYRWNPKEKYWGKEVAEDQIEEEKDWLESAVYNNKFFDNCVFEEVNIYTRFTK